MCFFLTVAITLLHGNILTNKSTHERKQKRATHKHFFAVVLKICPITQFQKTLEVTACRFPAQN